MSDTRATPPINALIVPVTPFQQNCSVVWCTKTMRGAIVDPGGDVAHIKDAAKSKDVQVEKILITHAHIDHAGGAADLAEDLGVPIEGPHKDDQFLIDNLEEQAARFGAGSGRAFTPSRFLVEGDAVSFGEVSMDVYHCPGHTPGHVIFVQPEARFALVGDVLFQGSIGRTDLPGGDFNALIASIRDKLWPLGEDIAFLPGHGGMSTFGQERKTNPFVSDAAIGSVTGV